MLAATLATAVALLAGAAAVAGDEPVGPRYRITIQNLTDAQPLSHPVIATHRASIAMFTPGTQASEPLEAIAEDGNGMPMFDALTASPLATDAVLAEQPLTPAGVTVGDVDDAVEVELSAWPGDRLSLATMLICTNDGFTGLDSVRLPFLGSATRLTRGYDAGTEENTEVSLDIVDPCSALGPVTLAGDPNGNLDEPVDSTPPRKPIGIHPGIDAIGDLLEAHDWDGPVARVTITPLNPDGTTFRAPLSGMSEVVPVATEARGQAGFRLRQTDERAAVEYSLRVRRLVEPLAAHIHLGSPAENGQVVAALYGPGDQSGPYTGLLAEGAITEGDLVGPLEGDMDGFIAALRDGRLYVNVHTAANPGGELRGQIGALVGLRPVIVRPDFGGRPGSRLPGR